MFAKLKKKVIEENGGRNMESGDRPLPGAARHSSGSSVPIHSPLAKEAPGGFGGLKAAYSTERLVTSDEPEGRESSISKDDLMALLTKRTEQCKKMEGNISDLAALIKDKNKTIDILETQTKQHEEAVSRRLAEQKSEFEAYQDKLIAGYQEDKLALDKEKRELVRKLQLAEEYRDKFLKWEADTDEMKDFTVQELGKVKHMLINAQSDLETCRKELDSKTQTLTAVQSREKQLETDLYQWKEIAESLEKKCEVLAEDNKERAELVTSLTKEKSVFERRLDQLNAELTERQGQMAELNRQLTELDSSYRALEHSSEQHRNKTAKLLAEKQDHIDTLQERVSVLEQRLHDGSLSGDDRVAALQTEREGLEKKLLETREQLSEIKSTWSDKISHLEAQISHLNTKTMEDSEELVNSQRAADSMRENFHKQMEDLRHQLEDAEKRALENYELACGKDMHHGQQVKELESELNRLRLSSVDLETQLRGEINSLEYQLLELQRARQAERDSFRQELEEEKTRCEEAVERELHVERALKAAETQHAQLQIEMLSQQEELSKLRHQLEETSLNSTGQSHKVIELEQQVGSLRADLNSSMADLSSARRQLNQIDEEKGELMVRNAQLSQQLTSVQQEESKRRADGECQLAERDLLVQRQEEVIVQLKNQLSLLEKQVQEFDLASASLVTSNHFEVTIRDLQDQLADKTRSLKKQEQTVKDLRQTLQRELKVQALPNDDTSDDNTLSPVPSRKISQRQTIAPTSTASQPPFISHSLHLLSSTAPSVSSPSMSSATVAVKPMTVMPLMQVSHERGVMVRRDLEQDINFQYLKHVVLKFMLSRESEAVQLIKAVAVLLNFTHQEQQLIKQTLEWKMSWFGPRPSMGKGQKSKIVPPSY